MVSDFSRTDRQHLATARERAPIVLAPKQCACGKYWGSDFLGTASSNGIMFTERAGALRHLDLSAAWVQDVIGVPVVYVEGQGGLPGREWRMVRRGRLLENIGHRFCRVCPEPDGLIYASTDNGAICRFKPQ